MEGQTNEGRKLPPVLQLPSGASTQGYSSFLFSSGFTGEGGCQQQPAEWKMLYEHQGDTKNLPPVLISIKTNQLIVHLLCKNSLKISQHPHTERHCQLQTLQTGCAGLAKI